MSAALWRIVTDRLGNPQHIVSELGESVCSFLATVKRNCEPEQVAANARLISAAPDLIEALILQEEIYQMGILNGAHLLAEATRKRKAAIAKATGEAT